jgi:hypothetical protein
MERRSRRKRKRGRYFRKLLKFNSTALANLIFGTLLLLITLFLILYFTNSLQFLGLYYEPAPPLPPAIEQPPQ